MNACNILLRVMIVLNSYIVGSIIRTHVMIVGQKRTFSSTALSILTSLELPNMPCDISI